MVLLEKVGGDSGAGAGREEGGNGSYMVGESDGEPGTIETRRESKGA